MLEVAIEADGEWDSSTATDRIDWAELAQAAAHAAIAESAFPQLGSGERTVELSIRLASDDEVLALNAEWRGKDKPTNVLSFPMAEESDLAAAAEQGPELMLGDIILARGVCAVEAAEKAIPLQDHAAHLMVHGTLHLLGYDHLEEADAADMEGREVRALARLGISDPYAEDR
ncbi:rRNA maturation RNase YbeY [Sphingomonas sp.]|uniref:rRNA maturation RNase YbeY n=1 Tax=Sphingomonas sp. TaxID=28214 RepID=UPI0025F8844B|nr:rRNA maturation RNase YbeY [Sphingomonas sp.]